MRIPPLNLAILLLLGAFMVSLAAPPATAQDRKFPFGRSTPSDVAPELSEKSGPWLILATSFSGEDGVQHANRLAHELRTKHKLKVYVYTHSFRLDTESHGVGYRVVELADQQKTVVPVSMVSQAPSKFDETAVLIGDFASIDDPHAQRTLERVKKIQPETILASGLTEEADIDEPTSRRLLAHRAHVSTVIEEDYHPLRSSFILANPLLPEDHFQVRHVDKFVENLNADLKYNLFKCPGNYSVKVATFTGASTMNIDEINRIRADEDRKRRNREGLQQSQIADAAKKATLLTLELRKQGYDAYEFHDRYESCVCIGSYEYLATKDAVGNERMNPEIEEMILKFKSRDARKHNSGSGTVIVANTQPISLPAKFLLAGIAFDIQPVPVAVPKKEGNRTANRLLNKFR